jgi:hypothetical protein
MSITPRVGGERYTPQRDVASRSQSEKNVGESRRVKISLRVRHARDWRAPAYTQVLNGPTFSESAPFPGTGDGLDITYDGTVLLMGIGLQSFAYRPITTN